MNKLLVASRARPDTDLPKYPGMCELPVLPLSLLTPDGLLYYSKEKRQLQQNIETFKQPKRTEAKKKNLALMQRKLLQLMAWP